MNKEVAQAVLERSMGVCEVCHSSLMPEIHHILRRKVEADKDNCIMLCYIHHRSELGTHGRDGHELDLKLKRELQGKYFDMGYDEDTTRRLMGGKLY